MTTSSCLLKGASRKPYCVYLYLQGEVARPCAARISRILRANNAAAWLSEICCHFLCQMTIVNGYERENGIAASPWKARQKLSAVSRFHFPSANESTHIHPNTSLRFRVNSQKSDQAGIRVGYLAALKHVLLHFAE